MSWRLVWIGLAMSLGLQVAGCGDGTAKSDDDAVVAVNPTGTVLVTVGSTENVTVTFTTNDGNAASSLSISSTALGALPSGWSSTNGDALFCAAFASGTGCQLTLTYTPTSAGSGTVSLPYSYDNDEGQSKTGTASIAYTSSAPTYAYVTDQSAGGTGVYLCALGASGTLSGCALTGDDVSNPTSLALYGSIAYVGNANGNITLCSAAADGALSNCELSSTPFPGNLTVYGGWLYYATPQLYGGPEVCAIGSGGALSGCGSTDAVSASNQATGVAFYNEFAYVSTSSQQGLPGVLICTNGSNGLLSNCENSGINIQNVQGVVVSQTWLYVMQKTSIEVCAIATNGALSACAASAPFALGAGWVVSYQAGMAISGGRAYLPYSATDLSAGGTVQSGIAICTVNSNGSLSGCTDSGIGFDEAAGVTIP